MRKQNGKRLAAAVLAFACIAGMAQPSRKAPVTAQAATIAELEAQKEANNKKIAAYEEQLRQYSQDQKAEEAYQATLTGKISAIESNLQILDTELENIKAALAQSDVEIAAMENTIDRQEEDIDKGLKEFKLRLRAMYVNGNDSLASALVGATDFYDLLSKYELISCVARHDDELVNGLKDELEEYHGNLTTLEAQKEQEEQQQADLEAKQNEMKDSMGELQKAYADSEAEKKRLAQEQVNANKSIEELEEQNRLADEAEKEILEEIRRAEEEAKKRAAEKSAAEAAAKKAAEEAAAKKAAEDAKKAAQQTTNPAAPSPETPAAPATPTPQQPATEAPTQAPTEAPTQDYSNASFGWPCPGHYYISSTYGYRWGTLHKGIDIAQNQGAAVVASKSGTVIRAVNTCTHNYGKSSNCCGNGYGNHVIIMHDDGTYSTLYGHMESITVSLNQYVNKGDTIGYVGSTGWSTGFHLHFEIRKNGTAVDPSGYLNY
ncbi:MAG: peptidoglycan DD-metalloendopeptidase family protein [Oscillospiraceae bacterium]|nr:peptidoglycan DD-metalloendopeptidase family protein [Oscillospiraceae bacterium]